MKTHFNLIYTTRNNFISLIDSLSIEEINKIPAGFNNNIAWNFGHIIVSAQGLCYRLSGLPLSIAQSYVEKYRKGTKPEAFISRDEIDYLRSIAIPDIQQLQKDFSNNIFTTFQPYETSFNVTLTNITDAIAMVQSHDALHYGYSLALRKAIKQ